MSLRGIISLQIYLSPCKSNFSRQRSDYADSCRHGNPRDTSVEEIAELYRSQM